MSGRVYSVSDRFTVTGISVHMELGAPTSSLLEIRSIVLGQDSDAGESEAEGIRMILRRWSTAGTGGSSVTPAPVNPGDGAAGGSYASNVTSQGTILNTPWESMWNVNIGWFYYPLKRARFWIPPGGFMGIRSVISVADPLDVTATVTFAEYD